MTHMVRVWYILPTWMVDFDGKCKVGIYIYKYPMGKKILLNPRFNKSII